MILSIMNKYKMRLGIIIQARVLSTRLPEKIILPIEYGVTFLDVLLEKIKDNFDEIPIILATSYEHSNDVLENFAEKNKILFFRGSEENVLKRFVDCSKKHQLDVIVRICSDNPFLDTGLLKKMIRDYNDEDYFSYKINGKPSILTHYGFFAEIVKVSALKRVLELNEPFYFEHVTNYIYKNEEKFEVNFIEKSIEEEYIRCTLDTINDFENLKIIYNEFYKQNFKNGYKDIIKFVSKKKELQNKMKKQILKNRK